MKQSVYKIVSNEKLTENVYKLKLCGDTSAIEKAGQFIDIKIDGLFLRRPLSVYDADENSVTVIFKVVGKGTKILASKTFGELDVLTGLGNGYDTSLSGKNPLLIGGGAGVPPMYLLAKKLIAEGKKPTVILGFNRKDEIFCEEDFKTLKIETIVSTADGSYGIKGFVTDAMKNLRYTHCFVCGPEPMLKAVWRASKSGGQFSFEERMGCGFGACMGCTCKTLYGNKRICKDGPVLKKEEIIWED